MSAALRHVAGIPVLACAREGPALDEDTAMDLIAESIYHDAEVVSVPAWRCPEEFFTLSSGVAGAVAQKFANYRRRLAIVGDISGRLAGSASLRAFVTESNRGNQLWFVTDQDELEARLRR